jgi:hypothetical protein
MEEGEALTYANYFKSQGQMTEFLSKLLSGEIKRCARAVLKS